MILTIVGPPASGKGTTATRIAKKYGLEHIAAGDLFRDLDDEEIRKYLVSGRLLPDELVAKVINKAMSGKTDFILDGYPRNIGQARLLDEFLKSENKEIDCVIYLKTSNEVVLRRMTNRRICPKCGKIYNLITLPPPSPGKCDCGGDLIQRADDNEKTIMGRIGVFNEHTMPILEHYKDKVLTINGDHEIKEIMDEVSEGLDKL